MVIKHKLSISISEEISIKILHYKAVQKFKNKSAFVEYALKFYFDNHPLEVPRK